MHHSFHKSSLPVRFAPYRLRPRPRSFSCPQLIPDPQERFIRSHDLPEARMQELERELTQFNSKGVMVTYSTNLEAWTPWDRPVRTFRKGGSALVAASGFKRVPDLVPPICPHAQNGFRVSEYSHMKVCQKTIDGKDEWVYQADHKCPFVGKLHISFEIDLEYSVINLLISRHSTPAFTHHLQHQRLSS
jgi:hypothetical protein